MLPQQLEPLAAAAGKAAGSGDSDTRLFAQRFVFIIS